jgi:hypothetical protein
MLSRLSALAAASFLLVSAQEPPTAPPASGQPLPSVQSPEQNTATISGTVVDAMDGRPLPWTMVCFGSSRYQTCEETNAMGTFLLKDIPPGTYGYSLDRTGYFPAEPAAGALTNLTTLKPGDALENIQFRMHRAGLIAGRVLHEDSEPFAGFPVSLDPQRITTVTNDLGEYRFPNLKPGDYRVNPGLAKSVYNCAHPPVRKQRPYIVRTDRSQIHLETGEQVTGVDFYMTDTPPQRISGRLVWDDAPPVGRLTLWNGSSTLQFDVETNAADGSFAICGAASGEYSLVFTGSKDGRTLWAKSKFTVQDRDVEELEVTPMSSAVIRGRIEFDDNLPHETSAINVFIGPSETTPRITRQPNGAFMIENIFTGEYRLVLTELPRGTYLKSVLAGGKETVDASLSIQSSEVLEDVVFVVGTKAGAIQGQVVDDLGKPIANADVWLLPDPVHGDLDIHQRSAATDQNGAFVLEDLAPGPYHVIAWRKFPNRPGWREQVPGQSTPVVVPETGRAIVIVHPVE